MHRVIAMLIIFAFNVLFWMFFEQAGSSFNFLAQNIVDRHMFGGWEFPIGWFQSVNPLAIVLLAPLVTPGLGLAGRARHRAVDPAQVRPGPDLQRAGLRGADVSRCRSLVGGDGLIPFWPLVLCYVLQTIGELCLSPIGLSMVTKLAPVRLVGFGMGGWFLSTGDRQQPVRPVRRPRQRRNRHDRGLGAVRLHLRLLAAGWCAACCCS